VAILNDNAFPWPQQEAYDFFDRFTLRRVRQGSHGTGHGKGDGIPFPKWTQNGEVFLLVATFGTRNRVASLELL
jgi:hypothetical protein